MHLSTEAKILSIIGAITLILLVGGVTVLSLKAPKTTTDPNGDQVYQIDYTKGVKIGSDSARVKLVEFGDLQCPACKQYEPSLQAIRTQYKDNPDFQFIFRHYPLYPIPHQFAKMAAEAVEEGNTQDKFWPYHDLIYTNQEQWSVKPDPTEDFANMATQVGVDAQKVRDAIKNNTYNDKIQADIDEGNSLGVNSTPIFFLNGKKLNLNQVKLEDAISQALK